MITQILTFLLLLSGGTLVSQELAITIDDSPRSATGYFDGPTRAKTLIAELKQHRISQVAFFSVSNRLDQEGKKRLMDYADAGHIIANHTHSHPDFNKLTLAEYSKDFLKAHEKLLKFTNYKKWFRYPFLREGNTTEKRNGMRGLLQQTGYINAYITLNNYDWYIESLFQKTLKSGKTVDLNRLQRFYIDVMIEGIEYYDRLAKKYLGYSPKHVLLIHETDITALFIGDLADTLRDRGWKIITPEEAYRDPIATQITDTLFPFNPGRIGEIAKDNGQKKGLWHSTLDESCLKERFDREVLATE